MNGQVIVISTYGSRITTKIEQLLIDIPGREPQSRPIEDIAVLMIENPGCTISAQALETLIRLNTAVIFCNSQHLPMAQLVPYSGQTLSAQRIKLQININEPL